jgi:competence ComEA-like helix-hairpin-helix protein
MAERLRFSRGRSPLPGNRRLGALALLFVFASAGFVLTQLKPKDRPRPAPLVVEVRGDVPHPGFHALEGAHTVAAALREAGAPDRATPDAVLSAGTRVVVDGDSVLLERMDELLVVGLPLDLNVASASALEAIPGLGAKRARSIVEDRAAHGPYETIGDLERVRGLGPKTVERMRPFVTTTRDLPAAPSP